MVMARFCARVRKRAGLPAVSIKDVYAHPTLRALAGALAPAPAAASPVQDGLAAVLADVLQVDSVDPDAHVFDDLGADSMVMARFCARVRKEAGLPAVSIKDVYAHPTLRGLASAVAEPVPAVAEPAEAAPAPAPEAPARTVRRATGVEYVLCGVMQALIFLAYSCVSTFVFFEGFLWVLDGGSLLQEYLRALVFGSALTVALCVFPIVAKWVLVGRWVPQQIPVWSLAYVRFWVVKALIRANPLVLLTGGRSHTSSSSPLHVLYLRALGAKIGRGVTIYSRNVPVCTDLLTIGDGTVIRKESFFNCYRAHDGVIQTGPVTLGAHVFVGEATVLDIGTAMGDGAQLGHASALHAGQSVPAGECWHGSPAEPTTADYRAVEEVDLGTARRFVFGLTQVVTSLVFTVPLGVGALAFLTLLFPWIGALLTPGEVAFTQWSFYQEALVTSAVVFFGFFVVGLLVQVTVPRLLNLLIEPDRVYPLYGFHYSVHRGIARLTNSRFFAFCFGDCSFIVHYLRALGYDLSQVLQTGSNFGSLITHETPFMAKVGRGTMIACGLSLINAEFSSTSFKLARTEIGADNFLGNNVVVPSQGRTGENCLLATKVQVPVDGEVRHDVGLLGSPSFEIPRTVARDARLGEVTPEDVRRLLPVKNRHNLVSIALYLLVRWFYVFLFTVLTATTLDLYSDYGASVVALFSAALLVVGAVYWILVERSVAWMKALRPDGISIYDRAFWRHERFWKLPAVKYIQVFNGTPFKNLVWRGLGVRIGKRVFDDGLAVIEKSFATIGDECTFNARTMLQSHSQEDGGFKSDLITVGSRCTLGVGAYVHYGTTIGDGAVLAADTFLMKGEQVPPGEHWAGNPAVEMTPFPVALPAPAPTPLPRPRDAAPTERPSLSVEELMTLLEEDGAPGPSSTVPLPRRSGRHRATQRHLAGSR
jgi:non-ribosomal peptide synthetase-like protein